MTAAPTKVVTTPSAAKALSLIAPDLIDRAWVDRSQGIDPRLTGYVADGVLRNREPPSSLSALLLAAANNPDDRVDVRQDTAGGRALTEESGALRLLLLEQASLALDVGIPIWSESDFLLSRATRWIGHPSIRRKGLEGALWALAKSPQDQPTVRSVTALVDWAPELLTDPSLYVCARNLVRALPTPSQEMLLTRIREVFYTPDFQADVAPSQLLTAQTTDFLIHLVKSLGPSPPWDVLPSQINWIVYQVCQSVEATPFPPPGLPAATDRHWSFVISQLSDSSAAHLLVGLAALLPTNPPRVSLTRPERAIGNYPLEKWENLPFLDIFLRALSRRSWLGHEMMLVDPLGSSPAPDFGVPLLSVLRALGTPTAPPSARFIGALLDRSFLASVVGASSGSPQEDLDQPTRPNRRL